ncbi:MAG: hypothetical protein ACFNVX_09935 [Lachnoanaerobaculum saburreum]
MDNPIYQREMMDFIKKFPNNGNVMISIHGRTMDSEMMRKSFIHDSIIKLLWNLLL